MIQNDFLTFCTLNSVWATWQSQNLISFLYCNETEAQSSIGVKNIIHKSHSHMQKCKLLQTEPCSFAPFI